MNFLNHRNFQPFFKTLCTVGGQPRPVDRLTKSLSSEANTGYTRIVCNMSICWIISMFSTLSYPINLKSCINWLLFLWNCILWTLRNREYQTFVFLYGLQRALTLYLVHVPFMHAFPHHVRIGHGGCSSRRFS